MKLSVIIPVYNEEGTVQELIERVKRVNIEKEIIIVNDGSKDQTLSILKAAVEGLADIKIISYPDNRGKGYAIRQGLNSVSGDVVLIQDADLEYDPQDYFKIMQPFLNGEAQVVYGSRFLGRCENMSFLQLFANRLFNFLTLLLHGKKISDTCTCYKAFRRELIKNLPLENNSFEICHEINARLLRKHCAIVEVPINYHARTKRQGKKVNWKVFFTSLYAIFKYRLKK
jgi:glycosyltransferase involved in cell wall biosynthesis